MPRTIRRERQDHAARVITAHVRKKGSTCSCGSDWSPFHLAVELDRAGALGPYPTEEGSERTDAESETDYSFGEFIQDVFGRRP